jgi:hypothetical protein
MKTQKKNGLMTCSATHHLWLRRCVCYQREGLNPHYGKVFAVIEAATIQSYRTWSVVNFDDIVDGMPSWGIPKWNLSRRSWQRGVHWLQKNGLILKARNKYAINLEPIFRNYTEDLADQLFGGDIEWAWESLLPTLDEVKRVALRDINLQLKEGGFGGNRSNADDNRQNEGICRSASAGAGAGKTS